MVSTVILTTEIERMLLMLRVLIQEMVLYMRSSVMIRERRWVLRLIKIKTMTLVLTMLFVGIVTTAIVDVSVIFNCDTITIFNICWSFCSLSR